MSLIQAHNMALLDQVLNPDYNFLDEDATMMAIDKISARDSGLRDYYNQQIQTEKYAYFEDVRKRKREVSSQAARGRFNVIIPVLFFFVIFFMFLVIK